jgi:hypothetical protein
MLHTSTNSNLADAVTEIHWSKIGTDENGIVGRYPGVTKFKVDDISLNEFTPLKSLKEDQVLNWVKNSLSEENKLFIDAQIVLSIESQSNVKIFKSVSMPWSELE